jgi:hypothetical protein
MRRSGCWTSSSPSAKGGLRRGGELDQAGLRNGKEIVNEYLLYGEVELALEHLIYMVRETGIALSEETRAHIRDAASSVKMKIAL